MQGRINEFTDKKARFLAIRILPPLEVERHLPYPEEIMLEQRILFLSLND
jgi:hypothetical protein